VVVLPSWKSLKSGRTGGFFHSTRVLKRFHREENSTQNPPVMRRMGMWKKKEASGISHRRVRWMFCLAGR
jgi:hypothetical protein